jgi:hypothetical protein
MWGRRRKRGTRLSRLLALGRLEEAMARAEQQQEESEPEALPYPPAGNQAPVVPAARPGHFAQDVPVDNSAGPAADQDAAPQYHPELPAQRTRDRTRHGSFG